MLAPIKILHYPNQLGSLNSDWFHGMVKDLFEFVQYDPGSSYSTTTLFYTNCITTTTAQLDHVRNQGFRVVYDNLWEPLAAKVPGALVLHNLAWFWYNESLWYQHLGLDQYVPARTHKYTALMPMNLARPHRTFLKEKLGSSLDHMIWSYVAQGRQLPGDLDMTDWNTQRYFNPDWYNQTHCSVVAETTVYPNRLQPIFITEKTYKPLAFQHPFVVYGNQYTLRTLKEQGFETYNNLWSEHYDSIPNAIDRGVAVVDIIKNITPCEYDALTLEKIAHNHARFFDQALVRERIMNEIISPIIHYAETT